MTASFDMRNSFYAGLTCPLLLCCLIGCTETPSDPHEANVRMWEEYCLRTGDNPKEAHDKAEEFARIVDEGRVQERERDRLVSKGYTGGEADAIIAERNRRLEHKQQQP